MKRSLFTFLLLPLLFACSKEKTVSPLSAVSGPTSISKNRTMPDGGPKINTTLQTSDLLKGWCLYEPTDCVNLGGVDIRLSLKALLDEAVSGGPTVVAAVFNNAESAVLTEYLGTDITNSLKAGSYWLTKSADNGRSATYLIGTTSAANAENMVLAFQIDVN